MNNITQILSDEHQVILKVIDVALLECKKVEEGKAIEIEFFTKTVDFIKNFADKFHHAKEEDILFKAMLDNEESLHCNPIPVMLHDHEEGRMYVKGIEEGIEASDVSKIIQNTRGYCYLLSNHISKEDQILYPMAEEALSEDEKERINQQYKEVEAKLNSEMDIESYKFV